MAVLSRPARSAGLTALLMLVLVAGWATPAHAHRGIVLTVHHDGRGAVQVNLTWTDGHPVTGPATAVLFARQPDGTTIGPAALRALPGAGPTTLTADVPLTTGRWTVTVDAAAPGIGQCTAELDVGPSAPPQQVSCGSVAEPAGASVPASTGGSRLPVVLLAAVILLIVLGGLVRYVYLRRR